MYRAGIARQKKRNNSYMGTSRRSRSRQNRAREADATVGDGGGETEGEQEAEEEAEEEAGDVHNDDVELPQRSDRTSVVVLRSSSSSLLSPPVAVFTLAASGRVLTTTRLALDISNAVGRISGSICNAAPPSFRCC